MNYYSFINFFNDNNIILTESQIKKLKRNNCLIISCFAGVGKNYAIKYLKDKGYKINTIEKYKNFDKSKFSQNIKKLADKSDLLFIPYYLNFEKDIDKDIEYILVYPELSLKNQYIDRYKKLKFSKNQIKYLSDNWEHMIKNCKENKYGISINQDTTLLDIIDPLI